MADGRTILRAGYGIFYGRTPAIMIGTAHSNNGINVQTITFTGAQVPTYPNTFASIPTGAALPRCTLHPGTTGMPARELAHYGEAEPAATGMRTLAVAASNERNPDIFTTGPPHAGPFIIYGDARYSPCR